MHGPPISFLYCSYNQVASTLDVCRVLVKQYIALIMLSEGEGLTEPSSLGRVWRSFKLVLALEKPKGSPNGLAL